MPFSVEIITTDKVIKTNNNVVKFGTSIITDSMQKQIDDINSKFPISDTKVVSETDYLANYLLQRGTL